MGTHLLNLVVIGFETGTLSHDFVTAKLVVEAHIEHSEEHIVDADKEPREDEEGVWHDADSDVESAFSVVVQLVFEQRDIVVVENAVQNGILP